jgi:ferritin
MIKPKVENAFNSQMNKEFYSYYLYLSMAAHFESSNLKGFAHWMRIQGKEEEEHAMKFYNHLVDRGGRVTLQPIEAPPAKWKSPREVFQDAYQHEQKVTGLIHKLVELAKAEKDHAADVFLQWFVKEQVEEEAVAYDVLQKLQLAGDQGSVLLVLDSELAKRAPAKKE